MLPSGTDQQQQHALPLVLKATKLSVAGHHCTVVSYIHYMLFGTHLDMNECIKGLGGTPMASSDGTREEYLDRDGKNGIM